MSLLRRRGRHPPSLILPAAGALVVVIARYGFHYRYRPTHLVPNVRLRRPVYTRSNVIAQCTRDTSCINFADFIQDRADRALKVINSAISVYNSCVHIISS